MYTQRIHLLVSVINQPVLSSSDTAGQCGSVMLSLQITEGGGGFHWSLAPCGAGTRVGANIGCCGLPAVKAY